MSTPCDLPSFLALCEQRKSTRAFSDERLSERDLLQLLDAARHAPSVQNVQPWHFHVIAKEELRASILDAACYGNFSTGNPSLVVVTCDASAKPDDQEIVWNPKELEYSCMGAMEHALLAAASAGLGGCWLSFHHGPVHAALDLPPEHQVVGGLLIGHPDPNGQGAGEHDSRKNLTDIVSIHE